MPLVATQLKLNGQGGAPVDRGSKNQRTGSSQFWPTSVQVTNLELRSVQYRAIARAPDSPEDAPCITGHLQPP